MMENQQNLNSLRNNREWFFLYQKNLIFAALDDIAGHDVLLFKDFQCLTPDFSWSERLRVANFFYRNMACNLLEVVDPGKCMVNLDAVIIGERFLSTPFDGTDDVSLLQWHGLFFTGTDLLLSILRSHNMLNWDAYQGELNLNFMNEIIGLYSVSKFNLME